MAKKKEKHFSLLKLFLLISFIISVTCAYGFFIEPKLITVKEYKITITNLTDNFNGFKIVQISDIHYGETFNLKKLKKLVKSVNEQKPDIVVLTGDLIDKKTNMTTSMASEISNELNKINAQSGKYAISGENDTKFDEWISIIQNSGFTDLNNTYDTIYKKGYVNMFIAGTSSTNDKANINDKLKSAIEYLNSFEKNGPIYKILLVHEPDSIDDMTVNPFNLILAGHTHGGQINIPPIGPIIRKNGFKKYYNNHYTIENSELYISNGLGGNKFRLFNAPSYNVYRLVKD